MKDSIVWLDVKSSRRASIKTIGDFEIRIYKNVNSKNKSNSGNYITFSHFFSEVYANNKKKRFGNIGNKIVFNINDQVGINLYRNKTLNDKKLRVCSTEIIKKIHDEYGHDLLQSSNNYVLIDLGNNTFLIDKLKEFNHA